MRLGDLLTPVMERNPPMDAVVYSVSERFGVVPQEQIFTKKIALDDKTKYLRVKQGDVVYNSYLLWNRAVGVCFDERGGCTSPAYVVLRPKSHGIERFLHYFLRSPVFTAAVDAIAAGSVTRRRTVPIEDVLDLEFELPSHHYQRAANALFSTLDDKIELNRRMSETLEAMARALFKSWFVDFDHVRAKAEGRDPGLPQPLADLFPARFVDSELGEIPEGWEVGTLADVSALNPEVWSKQTRPPEINYVDLSNTKWGRIEAVTVHEAGDAPSRAQRVLRSGDTIVGTVRPGNGSYAFISEEGLTGSTGFAALRPTTTQHAEFVYLAATASENIDALAHLADGAAYPAVRPEVVAATPIVRPGDEVFALFSRAADPLLAQTAQNERESRTLAALRDALLPKLISGELRVKDAAKLVAGECATATEAMS